MAVTQWGRSFGSQLVSRLIILVFTLLTLFFAYREGPAIINQTRIVADRLFGPSGERLGQEAVVADRATVNGLVLVGLGEGALLGIGYVIAGVSHPVLFGGREELTTSGHPEALTSNGAILNGILQVAVQTSTTNFGYNAASGGGAD
jgi:hypothetical protein